MLYQLIFDATNQSSGSGGADRLAHVGGGDAGDGGAEDVGAVGVVEGGEDVEAALRRYIIVLVIV